MNHPIPSANALLQQVELWARASLKDGKFYKGLSDALEALDKLRAQSPASSASEAPHVQIDRNPSATTVVITYQGKRFSLSSPEPGEWVDCEPTKAGDE